MGCIGHSPVSLLPLVVILCVWKRTRFESYRCFTITGESTLRFFPSSERLESIAANSLSRAHLSREWFDSRSAELLESDETERDCCQENFCFSALGFPGDYGAPHLREGFPLQHRTSRFHGCDLRCALHDVQEERLPGSSALRELCLALRVSHPELDLGFIRVS